MEIKNNLKTKTYGAFSPLIDGSYAITYAGNVGDPSLADSKEKISYFAPFYIRLPAAAFLSLDKKFIDGTGVEPNEVVRLDYEKHKARGKDNQLDRALEYIRTKNSKQ